MTSSENARRLRRSLLFVPASDPRKIEKAGQTAADTILLDLEDSVSLSEKKSARGHAAGFLRSGGGAESEVVVRVNPIGSPFLRDDLDELIAAGASGIMLPKCEGAKTLREISSLMVVIAGRSASGSGTPPCVLALVETATGVAQARALATTLPQVEALCFGHADFSLDMGLAVADASRGVVLHARCEIAIAARSARVAAIDTVFLDVRDSDGFREDARLGVELGFQGKLCIHPTQVAIANEVHTPSSAQVAYAERVLSAAREAEHSGSGAFTVDGKMVDAPLVEAQRGVLDRARRAGVLSREGSGS